MTKEKTASCFLHPTKPVAPSQTDPGSFPVVQGNRTTNADYDWNLPSKTYLLLWCFNILITAAGTFLTSTLTEKSSWRETKTTASIRVPVQTTTGYVAANVQNSGIHSDTGSVAKALIFFSSFETSGLSETEKG